VVEVSHVRTAADHFGHRETDDVVVDLFWSRRDGDEFRVEVEDRREHVRFLLYPTSGKEAIDAFYHPLAVARRGLHDEAEAARWAPSKPTATPQSSSPRFPAKRNWVA
jgi:hypothetical protein